MNDYLRVARIDPWLKDRFVVFGHFVAVAPSRRHRPGVFDQGPLG